MQIAAFSFVLLFASTSLMESVAQRAHLLKLQIVDPDWLPVQGAPVFLYPVSECKESLDSSFATERVETVTDANGSSDVLLPSGDSFLITVPAFGHLEHQSRCLNLPFHPGKQNWVQIRLRTNWLVATGLAKPDIADGADLAAAPIGVFAGVYRSTTRDIYRVTIDSAAAGLILELPSAEIVRLQKRSGSSFEGDLGAVRFNVHDRRLELRFVPHEIVAIRTP